MMEEHGNYIQRAVSGVILAVLAYLVFSIRGYNITRKFDPVAFVVGLASSAFVGAIVSWLMESYHIDPALSAVIISMSGYCAGTLLDTYYSVVKTVQNGLDKEVRKTIHSAGESARKKIAGSDKK